MPPKRVDRGKAVVETSRPRQRSRRMPNAHGIIFEDDDHIERYKTHLKRKLVPTRYVCDDTMSALGILDDVSQMFHNLGIFEFMHADVPTYERITLEFLSTVKFKLEKNWTGHVYEYFGTMSFRLYNEDYSMSVIQLGQCLRLPLVGSGAVPNDFSAGSFWSSITGLPQYEPRSAKASWIQNPCFRYAQKGLAFTLFGRGDSTGVAAKRELYLMHAMVNEEPVNVAAFAADHLGTMGRSSSGAISVGGMITQIADWCGCRPVLDGETPLQALGKLDLNALCTQGMLEQSRHGYVLVSRTRRLFRLPNTDKTNVDNNENWLYTSVDPEEAGEDDFLAGDTREEDAPARERGVPHPHTSHHRGMGASSAGWTPMDMDQFRVEQARQGAEIDRIVTEQLRQGAAIDDIQRMMQHMMLQFPQHPPPQ